MQTLNRPSRLAAFEDIPQFSLKSKILSYMADQEVSPSFEEYQALNRALQSGDDAMDTVMQWIVQNPKEHRQYFETALYKGLDQLSHEMPVLTDFFRKVEQKPEWYDQQKIDDALRFTYRLGVNNGFILRDLSLMTGYMYPGFNQPLVLTGALKKQAGTRLAETTKWWIDITEEKGFERFNKGFTSTIYVRFIHSLVRYHLGKSEKWDADTWGVPINQFDQAMTNIAFSGVVLIGIRALGIFPSKREVDSFLHFWKYAGWLMGIDEKWLVNKESDGWKLIYWMHFAHPKSDESSVSLGSSLSKEPFERQYRYMRPLQQKLAYRQHLEVTQFFIGRKKMRQLGLKQRPAAWFAYYLIARNLLLYTGARHSSKIDDFLLRNGRNVQKLGLALYSSKAKQLASMHQH